MASSSSSSSLYADVKAAYDCREVIRRFWPDHFKDDDNIRCPFHGDSNPSMSVKKEFARCHGACKKSWSAIDLYQEHHGKVGCSKKELTELVKEMARAAGVPYDDKNEWKDKGRASGATTSTTSPPSRTLQARWGEFSETAQSGFPIHARQYLESDRAIPADIIDDLIAKKLLGFWPDYGEHGGGIEIPVTDWERKTLLSIQHIPVGGGIKKFAKGTSPKAGFFRIENGGDHCVISEAVIDALSVFAACREKLFLDSASIFSSATYQKVKGIPPNTLTFFLDDDLSGIASTVRALRMLGPGRGKSVDWGVVDGLEGKGRGGNAVEEAGDTAKPPTFKAFKDSNDLLKHGHAATILKMVKGAIGSKGEEDLAARLVSLIERARKKVAEKWERGQGGEGQYKTEDDRDKDLIILDRLEAEVKEPPKRKDFGTSSSFSKDTGPTLSLEEHIAELNKMHAVIMLGGKCCILHEYTDPISKREDIDFWSVNDFHYKHAPRQVWLPNGNEGSKLVAATKMWIKSNQRREYDGLIFAPGTQTERYYNLFRGFAVTPIQGRWALFKRHIDQVIAGGDAAISKYILAWMAHLLQQPGGERPGTAIVLRGKQGTGKGFFVSQLGKILGHHFLHITQASHLTGKFNSHLKSALLVFVDEALWAGDKQGESVLKGIVTEDTIMVEHKGKDTVRMKNHVSIIVASNNEWVVPAGPEERRFLVLDVSEKHMQDRKYFQALFDEMNNGGREAMLYDLLNMKGLEKVDLRTIPRTDAQLDQICYSMSGIQKFWMEVLMRGTLLAEHHEWEGVVQTAKLYGEYAEFCKTINDRYPLAGNMFTKQLKKMTPEGSTKRVQRRINYKEGERYSSKVEWCLWFADLKDCRESFDKLIHKSIMWDREAEEEVMEKELDKRKMDAERRKREEATRASK